jgi:hypothetical protein
MSKLKIYTSLIILLILLFSILGYIIYKPIINIEEFALSNVYSQEAKTRFAPNGIIYTNICKFDILKPKIYTIFNEEDKKQTVIYSSIERTSYLDQSWDYNYVTNAQGGTNIYGKTFEETKKLFKSKSCEEIRNLNDDNNDASYPPLTKEEIANNKRLREKDEEIKKKEEQQNQNQTQFNNSTAKEKIEILEKELAIDKQLITCYNDYSKPIILKLEEVSKPSTQDPEKPVMEYLSPEEQQKIGDAYYTLQSIKEGEQLLDCKLEDASIAKFISSNYDNPTQTLEDSITNKTKTLEELKTQ